MIEPFMNNHESMQIGELVIENQEGFEELICRKDVSFNAADNV